MRFEPQSLLHTGLMSRKELILLYGGEGKERSIGNSKSRRFMSIIYALYPYIMLTKGSHCLFNTKLSMCYLCITFLYAVITIYPSDFALLPLVIVL